MNNKQMYLIELLGDISNYINLREVNKKEEAKNVLKKIAGIISSLILLDEVSEDSRKALSSLYEYCERNESLEKKDFDLYIYPLIIKLQTQN